MMMLVASVGWSALRQPPRSALRPPPRRAAHGLMTAAGRKRVVFLGTPECAARSLELLIAAAADGRGDFELAAVVSQPPARTGRKMRLTNSPVHVTAEEAGLPVLTPPNAKDEEFLTALADLQPDLCITAAYGCFLPQRFLDMPKFGTLNVHPSLLPLYRGAAPLQRCLEAGDAVGGVTVAFTVLKMDAGPVLRQQTRAMEGDEQFPELLVEMFETGTELLIDALPSVWDGSCQEVLAPQDNEAATGAKKVQKEEAELDLSAISALQAPQPTAHALRPAPEGSRLRHEPLAACTASPVRKPHSRAVRSGAGAQPRPRLRGLARHVGVAAGGRRRAGQGQAAEDAPRARRGRAPRRARGGAEQGQEVAAARVRRRLRPRGARADASGKEARRRQGLLERLQGQGRAVVHERRHGAGGCCVAGFLKELGCAVYFPDTICRDDGPTIDPLVTKAASG